MIMKISGFEEVSVGLRYAEGQILDKARKQMHRSSDRIVKEAKLNAPRDTGALEGSIHAEISYGMHGRLQITVIAGGVVNGRDVDSYAYMIHEAYELVHPRPGPNTLAKMAANPGRIIGSHFLTRAADAEKEKLERSMIELQSVDLKI